MLLAACCVKSVAEDDLRFLAYEEFGVASKSAPTLCCREPLQKQKLLKKKNPPF